MKKIFLLLALTMACTVFAQENPVNNYKYVIVPHKFEFFKEPNKYNMNELTKMVFEKYGFTVFYADQKLPDELALNKCLALYGDLENDSGLLTTGLYILLKDCGGQVIYKSGKGSSKTKDFKKAYYEALREASASMASLNYQYNGGNSTTKAVAVEEVKFKPLQPAIPAQATETLSIVNENQLFAQPIANGYQLVDMSPKVVLKMYKTSLPDNFTAQGEGKNGVVFKKGSEWFFEYYKDDKLVSEKLNIKF